MTTRPKSPLDCACRTCPNERGNITLLTMGLVTLTLAVVLGAATAAAIHLERKRLSNLADTVAVEIADEATWHLHYHGEITSTTAKNAINKRVSRPRGDHEVFDGLSVGEASGEPGGEHVFVHLSALSQPGPVPWMLIPWSDGITIEAESTANISD